MTSLEHQSFARDHLIEDMFLPQHPTPMSMSAPSGISISISSNVTYEDEHWHHDHSSSFQTPKALGPYHDQMTIFPIQHYHHDESYTLSSAPTSARGRSLSGTSTDSVTYSVASPRTTPPVPCLFNGASIQFSAGHDEAVSETDGAGSSSQEHLSSPLLKQEPPCSQDGQESSSSSDKPIADSRTFCPHEDCRDQDGKPTKFFSRKADVTRHHKSQHDITYIDCPRKHCERKGAQGFTRRDHLTEHLRGFHMENLPKRQTVNNRGKKKEKDVAMNGSESTTSTEDLHSTVSTSQKTASHSRTVSFSDQADQSFKQEAESSSDEEVEGVFITDEEYHPPNNWRTRPKSQKYNSKAHVEQLHPYARRPSKSQPRQNSADNTNRSMLQQQHSGITAGYETSGMMAHSPVFATHQPMAGPYTTGHIMSGMYATHQNMNSFCVSPMGEGYHNLQAHDATQYDNRAFGNFPYQQMQE